MDLHLESSASRIILPRLSGQPGNTDADAQRRWLCRQCHAPVTSEDQSLTIEGRYVHQRTNPHGFEFELGCFKSASGAAHTGLPTSEDTWFLGYCWSFALCRRCHNHLGWFFSGLEPAFYGLILKQLIAETDCH